MYHRNAGWILSGGSFLAIFTFSLIRPSDEYVLAADTKQEAALKREVAILQAELKKAADLNAGLQQGVAARDATIAKLKMPPTAADLQKQLDKAKGDLAKIKGATYVHTAVLRLKKDSETSEVQSLLNDLPSLVKIKSVRALWFGKPATKGRPDLAAKDYDIGITVLFDDYEGLKNYLSDPIHQKLADNHMKYFEVPIVYDYQKPVSP